MFCTFMPVVNFMSLLILTVNCCVCFVDVVVVGGGGLNTIVFICY